MEVVIFIVLSVVSLAIYFIPTMVAGGKENGGAVFIVNLFFGWSLIGWVIALVMALSSKKLGWEYKCQKCGLKGELPSQVIIFVCPNCKYENIIDK
jgi:predicted RNA-binding Zn-ribbon protein involved in translation (DUF1610 family)